jgi:hypothetical protein
MIKPVLASAASGSPFPLLCLHDIAISETSRSVTTFPDDLLPLRSVLDYRGENRYGV